jgi:hypothetical protein
LTFCKIYDILFIENERRAKKMFAYYVDLSQFNTVKDFVRIARRKACTIMLESNCGKWRVNGKSIMGILSLDLSKPVKLTTEDNDYAAFDRFRILSVV